MAWSHRIINDRMENSIKGRGILYNQHQHGGCARAVPAPPSLYFYIGWLRNFRFRNFATTLLLHNLSSATHPPLPSARRLFNAAWQCYFEMKTNTEPYFSILSSIILWSDDTSMFLLNYQIHTVLNKNNYKPF